MRHITDDGERLIRSFEGFSATPYLCPAGYLTIGFGHLWHQGDPENIDIHQAQEILHFDVAGAERSVLRLIAIPLSAGQFDALVSFTFNLGGGAMQRSTLRRKINRGEDPAGEFRKWVWAGGVKQPGLIRRREAEVRMYQS